MQAKYKKYNKQKDKKKKVVPHARKMLHKAVLYKCMEGANGVIIAWKVQMVRERAEPTK